MNLKRILILTILSILTIIVQEVIWFYSFQKIYLNNLSQKINTEFVNAYSEEISIRLNKSSVRSAGNNDRGPKAYPIEYFLDELNEGNYPLSCRTLDSLFSRYLSDKDILYKDIRYSMTDSTSITYPDGATVGWNKIVTAPLKTSYSKSCYVQASVLINNQEICYSLIFAVAATFLILLLVIICVLSQNRAIEQQKRLSRIQEDFTYAMIHDMKTPIGTIAMTGKALESDCLDANPSLKRHYLRILNEEAAHLSALSEKILEIAQTENYNIRNVSETVNISDCISSVVGSYRSKVQKKVDFVVRFNHRSDLKIDYDLFSEAISNIIDNAVKYSGETVRIDIVTEEAGGEMMLSIKDNGFGISASDLKRVFGKFSRGANARGTDGFGLGLSYVKTLMLSIGGDVEIDSREGQYTEVKLILPVKDGR